MLYEWSKFEFRCIDKFQRFRLFVYVFALSYKVAGDSILSSKRTERKNASCRSNKKEIAVLFDFAVNESKTVSIFGSIEVQ